MPWFRRCGLMYRPISLAGWTLSLLALAFCVHVFLFVDARSHSVSDTFYGVFPYWVPTVLAWLWIAASTSAGRDRPSE